MQAFRRKAIACGARFVPPTCRASRPRPTASPRRAARDGRRFDGDAVLLAAGAWTAPLAAQLGVALPVRAEEARRLRARLARRRCPAARWSSTRAGVWFRPEGRGFLAGAPPREPWPGDPDEPPLDDDRPRPVRRGDLAALAARVPAFEALRVRSAWAGYYEMNAFDHNGLAGACRAGATPITACGFSGHGMQQAPAVGAAMAALIAGGSPAGTAGTPALDALTPARVAAGRPLRERNVI